MISVPSVATMLTVIGIAAVAVAVVSGLLGALLTRTPARPQAARPRGGSSEPATVPTPRAPQRETASV